MSAPDSSDTEVQPIIANFRLPPFSCADTVIWFRRAEVQFRIKKISSQTSMANHVLAALPDALFPQLAEWLDSFRTHPV